MSKVPPPRKPRNIDRRMREHLTPSEVESLIAAAKKHSAYPERDSTIILVMYRHGLRVSELVELTWEQFDFEQGVLHVRRKKRGKDSTHPLSTQEIRALRKLQRQNPTSREVFVSKQKGPLGDSMIRKMVAKIGQEAGLPFPVHPHMLRHATGYKLANDGQDTRAIQLYLGHQNIQHTVRYTELASDRFKSFFKD
ncbi:MAG: tyrosine-type recombinase/integrase [Polynucleobacter sp.]|nr:tyrosine-type recombinase/integrase [Polynucleobacter sp.]